MYIYYPYKLRSCCSTYISYISLVLSVRLPAEMLANTRATTITLTKSICVNCIDHCVCHRDPCSYARLCTRWHDVSKLKTHVRVRNGEKMMKMMLLLLLCTIFIQNIYGYLNKGRMASAERFTSLFWQCRIDNMHGSSVRGRVNRV